MWLPWVSGGEAVVSWEDAGLPAARGCDCIQQTHMAHTCAQPMTCPVCAAAPRKAAILAPLETHLGPFLLVTMCVLNPQDQTLLGSVS